MKRGPSFGRRVAVGGGLLGLALAGLVAPAAQAAPGDPSPFSSVDVLIGTAKDATASTARGHAVFGNTSPAATTPFGLAQFGPATSPGGDALGGYASTDTTLRGFGMTALSGQSDDSNSTGVCSALPGSELPVLPYSGTVDATTGALPTSPGTSLTPYYLTLDNQGAQPGAYQTSTTDGTVSRLTATQRATVGSFTYSPVAGSATLLFNASGGNTVSGETKVDVDAANGTVSGYTTSNSSCTTSVKYRIYFSSKITGAAITSHGTWDGATVTADSSTVTSSAGKNKTGAYVGFAPGATVVVTTGLSLVSVDNAALNRTTEVGTATIDDVQEAAKTAWQSALGTVDVSGGTAAQRTTFYTALYHSLLTPSVIDDVNGEYRGFSSSSTPYTAAIRTVPTGHHEYGTVYGATFGTGQAQLVSLLFPEVGSDVARSQADVADQTGRWWDGTTYNAAGERHSAYGIHAAVASMVAFGADDFDVAGALASMVAKEASGPTNATNYKNVAQYLGNGWIEDRSDKFVTSRTLAYSQNDSGIARLAERLGDTHGAAVFGVRGQYWRNLLNQYPDGSTAAVDKNALLPRDRGNAVTSWSNFDMTKASYTDNKPNSGANTAQYDRGTALQYQWSVPQNMAGLIAAQGGATEAEGKLDTLLTQLDQAVTSVDTTSSTSTTGAYVSKFFNVETPWTYHWLGKPAKSQDVIDRTTALFTNARTGLPNYDELGALSASYVWDALGLFPATPGRAELLLATPQFDAVTIASQGSARTLSISAPGATASRYIASATLDGQARSQSWLPESFARDGGSVALTLSATSTGWGTASTDVPPSYAASSGYNAVGTSDNDVANTASLDVGGVTYSRQALATMGFAPGQAYTSNGVTFIRPDTSVNEPDHWIPAGQRLDMHGVQASKVGFIGTATNGPSTGTATIVYADGTTLATDFTFADWTNATVATGAVRTLVTRRNKSTGAANEATSNAAFTTPAPQAVDPTKAIAAIVLPDRVRLGMMHVFAVGTDRQKVPAITEPSAADSGSSLTVSGTGVVPGDTVTVTVGTSPTLTATGTADASGAFSVALAVPLATATGDYPVSAATASYTFEQTSTVHVDRAYAPVLSGAATVAAGAPYAFTGTGFVPDETVTTTFGGTPTVLQADSNGLVTGWVQAPTEVGATTLTAVGATSTTPATLAVTVVPGSGSTASLTGPARVLTGATFQLQVSGFADPVVTVTGPGLSMIVPGPGTFPVLAVAPSTPGVYTYTATGQVSGQVATTQVTVDAPYAPGITTSGAAVAGRALTVQGTGFASTETVTLTTGTSSTTVTTSGSGTFTAAVTLPTAAGVVQVSALGDVSQIAATTSVTVESYTGSVSVPATVAPGASFTAHGSGFRAGETVTVTVAGATATTGTVAADGTVDVPLVAPASPGVTWVSFTGATSYATSSAQLTVVAPTPPVVYTPGIAVAPASTTGGPVTVSGSGFAPHELVVLTHGSTSVSLTASATGTFSTTIEVPGTPGAYLVSALGSVSAVVATASVTVDAVVQPPAATPTASLVTPSVGFGGSVVVRGAHFGPGTDVTVSWSGGTLVTATADAAGELLTQVTLTDAVLPGTQAITVTGADADGAAASVLLALQVRTVATTASISTTTPTVVVGKGYVVTVAVTAGATGRVELFDGARSLGTAELSGGSATLRGTGLTPGSHAVSALYYSDGIRDAARTSAVTIQVVKATVATLTVKGSRYRATAKAKVTVKISSALTNGAPTSGKVRVYVGAKVAKTVKVTSFTKGKATVTLAKKYTKGKKKIKVKAVYVPTSAATTASRTSATIVLKRR